MRILRSFPTLAAIVCLALVLWYRPAGYGVIVFAIVGAYVIAGTLLFVMYRRQKRRKI